MDLVEKYCSYPIEKLVEIIEESDLYSKEALTTAEIELSNRHCLIPTIEAIAKEIVRKKIIKLLRDFNVVNDSLSLPESKFLDEDIIREIFEEEYLEWTLRNRDITPDSEKYILGGMI